MEPQVQTGAPARGIFVKFWGVRGSVACPGAGYLRYGGNTSCVEIRTAKERVILDAGTGLRLLGKQILNEGSGQATILLSHTHWDHISGFPFFGPAFNPNFSFHIMAGHLTEPYTIHNVLAGQMVHPFFPVPIDQMAGKLTFEDFSGGDRIETLAGMPVRTAPLNHPDGATAYRIDMDGVSVCYATDTEHVPGKPNYALMELIQGTDLLIYDCNYTDDEIENYRGWGHSTWQDGVRIAKEAGVKSLAIFHHSNEREDAEMDLIARAAAEMWDGAFVAREGASVQLG